MAPHEITRRDALKITGALFGWAYTPRIASAGPSADKRFVFINLRGALDGLGAIAPVGDPAYESARSGLVLDRTSGLGLDEFFVLNPNMPVFHGLYKKGEAVALHAVASAYRDRSHFDGQDVLESGLPGVAPVRDGWLNRALQVMTAGEKIDGADGLSIGAEMPLIMRGKAPVLTWMPPGFPQATGNTVERIQALYKLTDPHLSAALTEGLAAQSIAGDETKFAEAMASDMQGEIKGARRVFAESAAAAGKLLASQNGPRIATISLLGWDTHAQEGLVKGRLASLLSALDGMFEILARELSATWKDTAIVVATEFGRTVRINGTNGTDHGTATVVLAAGGAIKGGRVIADWPGLSDAQLLATRDLKPTLDLRAVLKGVLGEHLGVDETALGTLVFPDSAAVKPLEGLIRT
ncbi:DUF1501 domain-containing protein [soil metagenome]